MSSIWLWWFEWGAIIFLVTTIFLAALVIFDTMRRRAPASAWLIGVVLAPVLVLPSVIYKGQVETVVYLLNPASTRQAGWVLLSLGTFAGMIAVILAIGYFMTVSSAPARRPGAAGPTIGGGIPVWAGQGGGGGARPADPTRMGGGAAAPAAPPPRPPKPKTNASVYVRNGPGGPRELRLNAGRTTFGRALECDIMIDDLDVSRDHAHIQEQYGRFAIGDHGSTHGTHVNGQRIRGEVYLEDGDEIRLGPTIQMVFKSFA